MNKESFQNKFWLTVLMIHMGLIINLFPQHHSGLISTIAFGSCSDEDKDQPILNLIVKHNPDLFIYLGDNVYADTKDTNELKKAYNKLASKTEFKNLKQNTRIIATWDDHDYGWNDIGKHYELKNDSKKIFLDFFNITESSRAYSGEGIYDSYYFSDDKHTLQIILLDERTFRSDLKKYNGEFKDDERFFYQLDYTPHTEKDSTLLGEEQWQWLEKELLNPADIRIIASGTQFAISYNGYEAWANFPHEQKRMLDLIKKTKANGVLFISGDVHYAEISRLEVGNLYPIYDITSSGITQTWLFATPNDNRIEGPVMDNNFGLITVNWDEIDPEIKMELWDIRDNQRIEYSIKLSELSFKE
uniref:Alkaline phosphatase family protein n=1 Tax=Ignavibacterium album TaxID=591197 RepID=A0A7V2ZKL6_9BACT